MAQHKKKSSHRSTRRSGYKRRSKSNPGRPRHHSYKHTRRRNTGMRRHHYRRSNPGFGAVGDIAMNAVFVIAGAVGSRLLTQMVLGSNNTGPVGYAGNAVAGGLLWFLTEKVMKNRKAAHGIIAGTAVGIVLRLIQDYTPFGQYLSATGFGDYQMQSFVNPQVLVDPWNSTEVQIPPGWGAPQIAAAGAGVGAWSDYAGGGSDY